MESMRVIKSCLFAALLAGAVFSTVRAISPDEVRVEPALLETINTDETAGYLVYMREKADLSAAYGMNWRDRGRFVMETLEETAKRTQKPVRQTLDAQGAKYEAFWVDNVIVVKTSNRRTFNALRALPEVESLRARRKPILYRPVSIEPSVFINAVESNLTHIRVDQVWEKGHTGRGIVVGNIDTGVRYTHDILVNQYRGNTGGGSYDHNYNWWDPYSATTSPSDTDGHGSHTMGTMVGDDGAGNQVGVAPGAQWIAAMGFSPGATDAGLLSCGQFMTAPTDLGGANANPDLRPHLVNNSWGDCARSYDNWYQGVIDAWHAAGIYPVFSNGNAGNCGYSYPPGLNTVGNPARYGSVTGVGATGTSDGAYATFSNWGPTDNPDTINPTGFPYLKPQVCAPGTNRSATNTGDSAYMTISGTSMAAPHVAGLIALMWSASPSLVGDYATTENIIEETATPIDYDSGGTPAPGPGNIPNYATGWGEIDALDAIDEAVGRETRSVLAGRVTNASDSAPIPSAVVRVTATSYTATLATDEQGYYHGNITTGTYTVSFSAFGYVGQTVGGVSMLKNTTTTLDAALAPATFHTVSGVVCDALTSWPLYSQITVSEYPGERVWTDPVTGAYSIDLPGGTTWTLSFDAWVDGYVGGTRVAPPLAAAQTLDVGLQVDISNLVAPGYTSYDLFFEEDFESDNGNFTLDGATSTTWEWGAPTAWPDSTASGTKCWGTNLSGDYGNDEDAQLLSPVYDLSSRVAPLTVVWSQAYYVENSQYDHAYAECRVGAGPWRGMWEHIGSTAQQSWRQMGFDISDAAGSTVQFRFRLTSDNSVTYAGYYVDDLGIESGVVGPDGGLIVGNVSAPGGPFVGATVSNTSHTATTMATPDDPNVDDGFYTLYSPSGAQSATAEAPYYTPESAALTVPSGGTIRQDFVLDFAPYHTLSGIVQDPLAGWPLYAKVECAADGYPTTSTWSDPFTGAYSLSLVSTGDWTISGSAFVGGYNATPQTIGSPVADTDLTLNLTPSLDAPGYTSATYLLSEGFEGGPFPPVGWMDYDIDGGGTKWSSSTACAHSGSVSARHRYDPSVYQDGWLVTAPTTLTGPCPTVSFWEYSRYPSYYDKHSLWIKTDVFSAPPTGWVELAEFGNPVSQWRQQTVDLSAYAGQTVWLAFHYEGTNATIWHIDDFNIGQLLAPDGGLVAGFVTDADTSQPIDGATIRIADRQTQTVATPDDPAVDNGFYTLYSPAGSQSTTASAPHYYAHTAAPTVSAGDIVRQDFALAPAPRHTLSGTVQDSVTGWPLYAKVECSADGYVTTSTWSNPFTGAYRLSLSATGEWSVAGSAWVGGYNSTAQSIGSLSADTSLTLNLHPTLSAPGYTTATYTLNEGFEGALFAPEGWTVYDIDGGDAQWSSSTATAHSGSRSAAHQSSAGAYQDGWLVTPATTLTLPNARLSFWEVTGSPASYVKHSLWIKTGAFAAPPSGWTEVAEFGNPTDSWRRQIVDLSSYGGQTAWLAFRYEGQDATQWYIDDIEAGSLLTPTGGLVGGFVTDANTSEYLTGATVAIHDQETQTATTPDDPAVSDSLYFLYAPAGNSPSTATLGGYAPENTTVDAVAGQTARQDYELRAGQLQVSPDSLQVYVAPGNATTRTLTLTNTGLADLDFSIVEINLGATSLTLAAQPPETPEAFRIESPSKTADYTEKGVAEGAAPRNAIASGGAAPNTIGAAWETMTPLPAGRVFNAVVADTSGHIYVMGGSSDASGSVATNTNYRYDTATDTWQEMTPIPAALDSIDAIAIGNRIYIPGDSATDTTYVYNTATDTWSTIATNNGYTARSQYQVAAIGNDVYVLGGIVAAASASTSEVWILNTVSGTWSAGVPMQKSRTSFSAAAIDGKIYVAGGVLFPGFTPDMTAEKFDGAAWSYIASLPDGGGAYTRWSYNADGLGIDGLWLAAGRRDAGWAVLNHAAYYNPDTDTWTDSPTIPSLNQARVYMEGAVGQDGYFYVIGGRDSSGSAVYATNERLQVGFAGISDVPWLSTAPTTGTIAAGESLDVTTIMDSAGVSPGVYRASLRFSATTPYSTPIVPVTMVVSEQGRLQVAISPAEAVSDGAQWRLEGENDLQWSDSGDIRTDVPISSQTVEFRDATGWVTPANRVVYITTGSLTTANATYEPQTFALRYLAGVGGTVSEPTSQTVIYGEDGTAVSAIADEGYTFTQWSDGSTDNPRQDTNVTQNITVTAQFALNIYELTYIAGDNGSIDGETSRTMLVAHGSDGTTVTAMPDSDHIFLWWSDDSRMNPRIDTNVTSGLTVTAVFHQPVAILTSQTCSVVSDGQVFAAVYDYALGGGWVTALDNVGGGNLDYGLGYAQWLGFFVYDYDSSAWTRGLYIYKE